MRILFKLLLWAALPTAPSRGNATSSHFNLCTMTATRACKSSPNFHLSPPSVTSKSLAIYARAGAPVFTSMLDALLQMMIRGALNRQRKEPLASTWATVPLLQSHQATSYHKLLDCSGT